MTVAPHKRRFSVSVVTRQRKHPYPFREATTCVSASQCMASHGQNSHGCSLPFCSQQCEHIVSSVYLSGDRIVPPSMLINCGVFHYCFKRILLRRRTVRRHGVRLGFYDCIRGKPAHAQARHHTA